MPRIKLSTAEAACTECPWYLKGTTLKEAVDALNAHLHEAHPRGATKEAKCSK